MKDPMPTDIFKIGQVLNNTYEIIGVLGRGGTGEVYLARNQINEREIAIKALNARFSGNADYIELMKREDQMRAILHDAVVRYIEVSKSDAGHVFLVMDYIEGPSLNDVMNNRRLEERELLVIAHRVLEGLVPTHKNGIVHRDLSPDNIILRGGDPERATIIDFGIAKDTSAGAMTIVGNEFAGKYEYAAPEQLDGHADRRTDLYSLGASLLAAWRREIPFLGNTPGEIVRRKAEPLDTGGVNGSLKEVIEWLAAPDPNQRPQSAEEALERLGGMLKPLDSGAGSKKEKRKGRNRSPVIPVLAMFLVGAVALGAWLSGALDSLIPRKLPLADPYELLAGVDANGAASFASHAPGEQAAQALMAAFRSATGADAPAESVVLAQGVPSEAWPVQMAELIQIAGTLPRWDLKVSGTDASLDGLAGSRADRATLEDALAAWSEASGLTVDRDIAAGPEQLSVAKIQTFLDEKSTCGRLNQLDPPAESYPLYAAITITGDLANVGDAEAIKALLEPDIGDRTIRMQTTTLNEELCAIRAVLPKAPVSNVSISLSEGTTGETSLTGIFHTGNNPVADVLLPGSLNEGSLWVMVVDNTGKVFHVLPNINQEEHAVAAIGAVENGVRRVRVLWSIGEFLEDQKRLAMRVTETDHGKSEIVAILSRQPLFDLRRPRDESVTSVAEALDEAISSGEIEILGMASRIVDARP